MKRQLLILVGGLSLLLAGGSASAQNLPTKFKVPFDFIANGQTMPPGDYQIVSLGDAGHQALLIKAPQSRDNRLVLIQAVLSAKPAPATKLVFHQYGNVRFLSQVWVEGRAYGRELPEGVREKEVAAQSSNQKVEVAATLH